MPHLGAPGRLRRGRGPPPAPPASADTALAIQSGGRVGEQLFGAAPAPLSGGPALSQPQPGQEPGARPARPGTVRRAAGRPGHREPEAAEEPRDKAADPEPRQVAAGLRGEEDVRDRGQCSADVGLFHFQVSNSNRGVGELSRRFGRGGPGGRRTGDCARLSTMQAESARRTARTARDSVFSNHHSPRAGYENLGAHRTSSRFPFSGSSPLVSRCSWTSMLPFQVRINRALWIVRLQTHFRFCSPPLRGSPHHASLPLPCNSGNGKTAANVNKNTKASAVCRSLGWLERPCVPSAASRIILSVNGK